MTQMTCSCGANWLANRPFDALESHMLSHAGTRHLVWIHKSKDGWFLETDLNEWNA
jgi:hypothetical protein